MFSQKTNCCLCSCSLSFALPLIFILLAANIPHFLTTAIKFSCVSKKNLSPLFLSLTLVLSLLSMSAQTLKLSQRRDSALLLFFLSKSPGVQDDCNMDVYHQAPLKVKRVISHWLSHGADRAKILLKFLGCMDNQIISPMVLRCVHFAHVRAPTPVSCVHDDL